MNLIDGIIIIALLIFVGMNLALGLIHALGSLIGFVVGLLVARFYYLSLAALLAPALFDREGVAKVVAFLLIFFIVQRALALAVHFIQKIVRWLPFGTLADRLGGIVVGFVEGVLIISILVFFLNSFIRPHTELGKEFAESRLAQTHLTVSKLTLPLIPQALREAQNLL